MNGVRFLVVWRRLWLTAGMLAGVGLLAGCQTAAYYRQAAMGQWQILANREPIGELLAGEETPEKLKAQLRLVLSLREFAERELKLPVNGHYERYVDVGRPFVVWSVQATPELSLKPTTWWYPIVGRLKYRGYFAEADAREYAATLAGQDVYVEGVRAYSTLGWFADPVLNTFVDHGENDLAQLLFHELAHQRLFVKGDTDFNEAFATAVGEEGVRRWLQAVGRAADWENYREALARQGQFVRLVQGARERLRRVYAESEAGGGATVARPKENVATVTERRAGKAEVIAQLRRDYEALKSTWGGYAGYDRWFALPLNNARLNTVATYHDLVPGFHALLQACGGDLAKFYAAAARVGKLPSSVRRARLMELGGALRPGPEIPGRLCYGLAADSPVSVEPERKLFGKSRNLR
ncbi:aminopeptidase [Verrucomicrobiota bacterium]|nr:aminopeptidase [Verrucomicrobiota bacterium]